MITRHVADLVVQLRLEHAVGWHGADPDPRCLGCAEELAAEDEAHDRNAAHDAQVVKQLGSAHGPGKGGPIETWPAELQVREWPASYGHETDEQASR